MCKIDFYRIIHPQITEMGSFYFACCRRGNKCAASEIIGNTKVEGASRQRRWRSRPEQTNAKTGTETSARRTALGTRRIIDKNACRMESVLSSRQYVPDQSIAKPTTASGT